MCFTCSFWGYGRVAAANSFWCPPSQTEMLFANKLAPVGLVGVRQLPRAGRGVRACGSCQEAWRLAVWHWRYGRGRAFLTNFILNFCVVIGSKQDDKLVSHCALRASFACGLVAAAKASDAQQAVAIWTLHFC